MHRCLLLSVILIFTEFISYSQSATVDKYYHGRIEFSIKLGKEYIAGGNKDEGINSYKEAIEIAEIRTQDWYSSFLVCNNYILEPVIKHYYDCDSLHQAHRYLDLYYDFHERFECALKDSGDITEEEFWHYMETISLRAWIGATNNNDKAYQKKSAEKYISICRKHNFESNQLVETGKALAYQYLEDKQYLKSIDLCSYLYDISRKHEMSYKEVISIGAFSHNRAISESRKDGQYAKYANAELGNDANESWISFLQRFYDNEGVSYADSLLIDIDLKKSIHEEVDMNISSSTYAASLMTRCNLAVPIYGYDKAIEYLSEFKDYLISRGLHNLWPIAVFNFINEQEARSEYSAVLDFCRIVQNDMCNRVFTTQNQEDEFYLHYCSVAEKNADLSKWVKLCTGPITNIQESSSWYFIAQGVLGEFWKMMCEYDKSLNYRLSALSHFQGEEYNDIARCTLESGLYSSVGDAYMRCHDYSQAETYLLKALEIAVQYCDENQQLTPKFYLGELYHKTGKLDKAQEFFLACVQIQKNKDDGFMTSAPLSYLFDIKRQLGNIDEARKYLYDHWQAILQQYYKNKDFLTIQEQSQYWQKYGNIQYVGGLITQSAPIYNDIYYDILLASKGFLLKGESEVYNNVIQSGNEVLKDLYNKAYVQKGATTEDVESFTSAYRKQKFVHFGTEYSWVEVKNCLSKNEAAVEFFECCNDSTEYYGALVIHPNSVMPKFIRMCESEDLHKAIQMNAMAYKDPELLYNLLWKPIEDEVRGAKRLYISPYKDLLKINIGAIETPKGRTLNDLYEIYRVSSTQNISNIQNTGIQSAYLYGGLVYDSSEVDMINEHRKYSDGDVVYTWSPDTTFRSGWNYLPNTLIETNTISSLLVNRNIPVIKYEGIAGTEESFKALSGRHPGLLHLATHGFYLQYHYADSTAIIDNTQKKIESSNPAMMRSGLILSNGARAWKGKTVPKNVEDGILQADEISNLDLSGTSLLVLSACETALGDATSDGMYGLQRAFKQAGVQTIIMSLWEVNDEATSVFMSNFYSHWLKNNDKHSAFVYAQNKLKKQYPDPFYWAAFIMLD